MAQAQSSYDLTRLINPSGAAEGSNLPPRQIGQFRVPFVTGLRLVRTQPLGAQTQFTVAWDNPSDPTISHYAVYIVLSTSPSAPPLGPYNTEKSPAQVTIPTTERIKVTFVVQTVLNNGMVSSFSNSPSCGGETTDPAAIVSTVDANITNIDLVSMPTPGTVAIETIIVARRTGGSSGTAEDGARFKLSAVYKLVGGAYVGVATLIGAVTKVADKDQAGWDANFVPASFQVLIQVTGSANNNIDWKATTTTYTVV